MGNCCGSIAAVPSPVQVPSTGETPQPTRTSTPTSPKPGTAGSARSLGATSSQPRHDGGRDYLPLSSGGDVFYPDHTEIYSPPYDPYLSSGTGPTRMRRAKSASVDITDSRSAHSPGSMKRSATMGLGIPPISGLSSATNKSPARSPSRRRFPFALQNLLPNDFRFRILVVGKRGCGKSSLIRAIFNVDMSPSPNNIYGRIAEFRPDDNRHLIVHECSASGYGEMQAIQDFITTRNDESRTASERLHAVWICIQMLDVINGQVDEGVKMLLDIGVPSVIVFTKLDLIPPNDYEEHCRSLFGNVPADIVSTRSKFRHLINKLVTTTDEVITHSCNISAPSEAQPRLSPESLSWSISQRASRDINVNAAIEVGRSRYWRRLWSSDDFVGQALENCVEIIHEDIVGTWNLPDKDEYFSSKAFKAEISYLVQDLTGSPINASSRYRLDGTPGTGAAWLNGRYDNSYENICLVMAYIVDLILILCRVFGSHGNVSPGGVQSVVNGFADSSLKMRIHNDISSFVRMVPQFQYHDKDVVVEKIIDLVNRNCDPPSDDATYE